MKNTKNQIVFVLDLMGLTDKMFKDTKSCRLTVYECDRKGLFCLWELWGKIADSNGKYVDVPIGYLASDMKMLPFPIEANNPQAAYDNAIKYLKRQTRRKNEELPSI